MATFDQQMNEHQTDWRKKNVECTGTGEQLGRRRPWILPRDLWEQGLWPGIRKCSDNSLSDYLKLNEVQKHGGVHNLKSSWVLCANMYFPFGASDEGRALFASFLKAHVDEEIDTLETIELEFAEPRGSQLHPSQLLGEEGGNRGANQTSPDLGLRVNGRRGLVLVENKFTEHSFYECSAWRHKGSSRRCGNPDPGRCDSPLQVAEDESRCHQSSWRRRYWEHLAHEVDREALKDLCICPAARHGYQLFRQQALAEGIARSGKYDLVVSAVAIDERNGKLEAGLRRSGIGGFEQWGRIFRGRARFAVFTHQKWVDWVRDKGNSRWGHWLSYVTERYGLRD